MTEEKCPRCNRPLAESSDAWIKLAGSDKPDLPQKKDYCGVVGEVFSGKALSSCEKWERVFLRSEVERLKLEVKELKLELEEFKNC